MKSEDNLVTGIRKKSSWDLPKHKKTVRKRLKASKRRSEARQGHYAFKTRKEIRSDTLNHSLPSYERSTNVENSYFNVNNVHCIWVDLNKHPEFYYYCWPGSTFHRSLAPLTNINGKLYFCDIFSYDKQPNKKSFYPLKHIPQGYFNFNRFASWFKKSQKHYRKRQKDPYITIEGITYKIVFEFEKPFDKIDGWCFIYLEMI